MPYGDIKRLSSGQAHHTASLVYTGTSPSSSAEIGMIWLHNVDPTRNLSASLFWQDGTGSAFRRINEVISSSQTLEISPKLPFIITSTGSIYLSGQNSASINYFIVGREQT